VLEIAKYHLVKLSFKMSELKYCETSNTDGIRKKMELCSFSDVANSDIADLYKTEDCERAECKEKGCCSMAQLPVPASLKDLVMGLQTIFAHDKVNEEFVRHYMGSYKSSRKEWKRFAIFDEHR